MNNEYRIENDVVYIKALSKEVWFKISLDDFDLINSFRSWVVTLDRGTWSVYTTIEKPKVNKIRDRKNYKIGQILSMDMENVIFSYNINRDLLDFTRDNLSFINSDGHYSKFPHRYRYSDCQKYIHFRMDNWNEEATVDAEELQNIFMYNWGRWEDGDRNYVKTTIKKWDGKRESLALHRLILGVTDKNIKVDHINGNQLDNRKENLRLCTNRENSVNRGPSKNNTSGFKGVTIDKCGKWQAAIYQDGKRFYLGLFTKKEDAARAYDIKAVEMHGDFVKTNFPLENYR